MQLALARTIALALLAIAPMAAACGGKVVIDTQGGPQGQGGGGGDVTASCTAFCAAINQTCPPPHPDLCAHDCSLSVEYTGVCASLAEAYLACVAKLPSDQACSAHACDAEKAQLEACTHPPGNCSQPMPCVQKLDGSHCEQVCGANVYGTLCTVTPPAYQCTCVFNGATVGTCTDALSAFGECCDATFASL